MNTERMTRPRLRLVGGVCAGFAAHTGLPVSAVRTVTLLLALCGGAGALLYAWLWVTTPAEAPGLAGRALPKASLARPAGVGVAGGAATGGAARRAAPTAGAPVGAEPLAGRSDAAGVLPDASANSMTANSVTANSVTANTVPAESVTADRASASNARQGAATPNAALPDAASARSAPVTEILLGLALLAAGTTLVASRLGADIPLAVVIPAIVVLAGVALAWRQFADIRSGAAQRSSALLVRALGALVLVVVGILLFFVTGDAPNVWTVIVAAVSALLGVAVVIAP